MKCHFMQCLWCVKLAVNAISYLNVEPNFPRNGITDNVSIGLGRDPGPVQGPGTGTGDEGIAHDLAAAAVKGN